MATLMRPANRGSWEYLRTAAGDRVSAFLTGRYFYTFANTTDRTVKMHLTEDALGMPVSGKQDYYLTVPAGATGVEVPMKADMILVAAGFFVPQVGAYEVFWEPRRFAWESGCVISVGARHSVESNKYRVDVHPGAKEVPRTGKTLPYGGSCGGGLDAPRSLRLLMLPEEEHTQKAISAGGTLLKELRVYSQRPGVRAGAVSLSVAAPSSLPGTGSTLSSGSGSWAGSAVTRAMEDGSLEVQDSDGSLRIVRPEHEVSLVALPAGTTAAGWVSRAMGGSLRSSSSSVERTLDDVDLLSVVSDMAPPPASRRHIHDKISEVAGPIQSLDWCATFSTAASPCAAAAAAAPAAWQDAAAARTTSKRWHLPGAAAAAELRGTPLQR